MVCRISWATITSCVRSPPGSGVSDTRIVSPMPSCSSTPIAAVDATMPLLPMPASVSPRCSGYVQRAARLRYTAIRSCTPLTLALITILSAPRPSSSRALGAVQRRHDDGLAHHIDRRQRRRLLRVLIHHARQQVLIEAAPVDADAHRLCDTLQAVSIISANCGSRLLPRPTLPGLILQLPQRLRTVRMRLQQLVAVEMEIADQRRARCPARPSARGCAVPRRPPRRC